MILHKFLKFVTLRLWIEWNIYTCFGLNWYVVFHAGGYMAALFFYIVFKYLLLTEFEARTVSYASGP